MPSARRLLALLCAMVLLGVSRQSTGIDPPSKKEFSTDYAQLISQLVSPNQKPVTENGADSSVRFPTNYDVAAQKRIEVARQTLHDDIENALPYLIGALNDERYCMTIDWMSGDAFYNYSVGQICENVIASQLEVYREKIRFSGPAHWKRYDYPISKQWWDERKSRRLSDLQVEATDWAIERRKAEPKDSIREGRENEVAELKKLRDEIAKSGKPAKPRGMLRMVTRDRNRRF
jgi:hypothetical protein